jgi:hypothetical protein
MGPYNVKIGGEPHECHYNKEAILEELSSTAPPAKYRRLGQTAFYDVHLAKHVKFFAVLFSQDGLQKSLTERTPSLTSGEKRNIVHFFANRNWDKVENFAVFQNPSSEWRIRDQRRTEKKKAS